MLSAGAQEGVEQASAFQNADIDTVRFNMIIYVQVCVCVCVLCLCLCVLMYDASSNAINKGTGRSGLDLFEQFSVSMSVFLCSCTYRCKNTDIDTIDSVSVCLVYLFLFHQMLADLRHTPIAHMHLQTDPDRAHRQEADGFTCRKLIQCGTFCGG